MRGSAIRAGGTHARGLHFGAALHIDNERLPTRDEKEDYLSDIAESWHFRAWTSRYHFGSIL